MLKRLLMPASVCVLIALPLLLGGCSCGFDCNNEDSNATPTVLTLGISDALPEDLKQVVIEVDSITFSRTGADDVVVDSFTIPALGLSSADTFQVDLLQYRGRNQLQVITDLELTPATYSQVRITVLGGDVNRSYVQEEDDTLRELNVSGGVLVISGATFARSDQAYTVEFNLAQSLQVDTGQRYLMTADGIRLEDNSTAASLSGRVDSSLFDLEPPCSDKEDPTEGNRIYLYEGTPASDERLGDVFRSSSATPVPANVVAPFAVATLVLNDLTANWEYAFGFLPAGDYTLAFACNTAADNSVDYDDLLVPEPADQTYSLTLTEGDTTVCDVTSSASC